MSQITQSGNLQPDTRGIGSYQPAAQGRAQCSIFINPEYTQIKNLDFRLLAGCKDASQQSQPCYSPGFGVESIDKIITVRTSVHRVRLLIWPFITPSCAYFNFRLFHRIFQIKFIELVLF
jgi:hypothetical protein